MKKGNKRVALAIIASFIFIIFGCDAIAQKNNNADISDALNIKNYQKSFDRSRFKKLTGKQLKPDQDIVAWTKKLESRFHEDAKNLNKNIKPDIKITKENVKLAHSVLKKFQDITKEALGVSQDKQNSLETSYSDFLIFASFSIGEKNLKDLIQSASRYEGVVVLRGFKNGSFKETAEFFRGLSQNKETQEGILIDPSLFKEYQITIAPTFVLTKSNCSNLDGTVNHCQIVFDKLTGNVSPLYALEKFSQAGELSRDAKERLGR